MSLKSSGFKELLIIFYQTKLQAKYMTRLLLQSEE